MALTEAEELELLELEEAEYQAQKAARAATAQRAGQPTAKPSFGQSVMQSAGKPILEQFGGLADAAQRGLDFTGEKVAEGLASGVSLESNPMLPAPFNVLPKGTPGKGLRLPPEAAAAVGLGVQMAPDLATLGTPPGAGFKGSKALRAGAEAWAQRALGIPKAQLKTPFARGQAAKAAKAALDEGVIPWSGSREVMAQRANDLANKAGSELGEIRRSVGPQPVDDVFDSLETLRKEVVGDRTGGIWDEIGKKIDKAQESIIGLIGKEGRVGLDDVEKTKNILRDTVNYMSDAASQKVTKQTTRAIESGVEKTLAKSGADVTRYKTAKQKFGAAKKMLEGLDVSASAQGGNNRFGPIASGSGIMSAAMTGNPLTGVLSMLGIETAKRRGPGLMARLLEEMALQSKAGGEFVSPIASLALTASRRFGDSRQ